MGKVLVLGQDTRSFLTVIRSLGRSGIEVHVGWCPFNSPSRFSRYIKKRHEIPRGSVADTAWKKRLKTVLTNEKFDLVIPCDDPSIIPLQHNKDYFQHISKIYLLDDYAFNLTYNKYESFKLAERLGLPIPKQMEITVPFEAQDILSQFRFPIVLKSLSSFTDKDLDHRREVSKAFSGKELETALSLRSSEGELLVQENIIGSGVGIEVLCEKGQILVAFQHLRVHEPLLGGGSSYRKSVPLNPNLLNATSKLMDALVYTGVAMVEYKVNMQTGEWVFLEINGRFWGSLPLAVSAGINFPLYLYQLLVEGRRLFPQEYRTDLYCRNLVLDVEWMRQNHSADRSNPYLTIIPFRKTAIEAFQNIAALRERSDTFAIDDLRPAFIELFMWMKAKWSSLRRKFAITAYSTQVLRIYSKWRILSALSSKGSVLFVCYGNIIRSPFAQGYAKTILPNLGTVLSAGYYPKKGRPSPDRAREAANEFGVDLSQHSSTILTEEITTNCKIIFVFDECNYKFVVDKYPADRNKVFFLGTLLNYGNIIIHDPYNQDIQEIRRTYRRIAQSLCSLKCR